MRPRCHLPFQHDATVPFWFEQDVILPFWWYSGAPLRRCSPVGIPVSNPQLGSAALFGIA
jgi:hypothetical protein